MSQKRNIYISEVVRTVVAGAFADFCNPKMCPKDFNWNRFTPFCIGHVEANLPIYTRMYDGSNPSAHDVKFAKDIAQWFADNLVKRAGFIEED